MLNDDLHVSDQELIQAADGELSASRAGQVHAHLAACWTCRARMAAMEATIVEFTRAWRNTLDRQLPPIAGPRALLRAQLAEFPSRTTLPFHPRLLRIPSLIRAAIIVLPMAAAFAAMAFFLPLTTLRGAISSGTVPNRTLTPGATRDVTIGEVCSMPHEEVTAEVSAPLRRKVLEEYGIANARPGDYEIDYLITPGLGGAEDIRNLWPEPYRAPEWNAHTKDALEEHLHRMVCAHQIDLPTAQRAIASNWVAAYKRYFHTDRPLPPDAQLHHS